MKKHWKTITMALYGACLAQTRLVLAQTGMENDVKTELNGLAKFIVAIVTGPIAKILALLFLIAAIWKIVHKDYGSALGCVLALLVLIFLPQILGVFK